jgi:hypothetical protein
LLPALYHVFIPKTPRAKRRKEADMPTQDR